MTLFEALQKSEEYDCHIIHRQAGLKLKHTDPHIELPSLPKLGWALDDTPAAFTFEANFLGVDKITTNDNKPLGTVFSFDNLALTTLAPGTKVKVTIEPL